MKYIALIDSTKSIPIEPIQMPLHEHLTAQTIDANGVMFNDGIDIESMYIINTLEVGEILYNLDGGLDLIRIQ
jgi:hypothetical protein